MAQSIDLMLCIFPFEPELYEASGLRAIFVGHPMTSVIPSENAIPARTEGSRRESVKATPTSSLAPGSAAAREDKLVGLFPGSREREVKKIFPIMRQAAVELSHQDHDLRFRRFRCIRAVGGTRSRRPYGKHATGKFSIVTGDARSVMARVNVGMVASGQATLEAALSELPFVLIYPVASAHLFGCASGRKSKIFGNAKRARQSRE